MSDNADRPAQESDGADPNAPFDVEDVDALLADVQALTSKVESEIGLPDGNPTADPVAVADQIADDVLKIERSVAASTAEAAEMLRDDPTSFAPGIGEGRTDPPADLVSEEDIAVADSEIFANAGAEPTVVASVDGGLASSEPGVMRAPSRIEMLRGRVVELLANVLTRIDRPFAHWPDERKALVGYIALATLVMATAAWILGIFVAC
jgi:hypothetical protein